MRLPEGWRTKTRDTSPEVVYEAKDKRRESYEQTSEDEEEQGLDTDVKPVNTLSPAVEEATEGLLQLKLNIPCSPSTSTSNTNEGDSESDEEELIEKGPDRAKISLSLRQSTAPYKGACCVVQERALTSPALHSGGTVRCNSTNHKDFFFDPLGQLNYEIKALNDLDIEDGRQSPTDEVTLENLMDIPLVDLIRSDPLKEENEPTTEWTSLRAIDASPVALSVDSNYGTMSPNSYNSSSPPNTHFDPYLSNQSNSPGQMASPASFDFAYSPPSCSPLQAIPIVVQEVREETQSWENIPYVPYQKIAPSSPLVNEAGMKQPAIKRMTLDKYKLEVESKKSIIQNDLDFIDANNETKLMRILSEDIKLPGHLERLHCFLHYLKREEYTNEKKLNLLMHRNKRNLSALQIAALGARPIEARYIVDTIVAVGGDPDIELDEDKNRLLHVVAREGMPLANVLAELLNATTESGRPVFNVNAVNKLGETALHQAVRAHSQACSTVATVHLLITHTADITAKAGKMSKTPLLVALEGLCDPELVKHLLQSQYGRFSVNIADAALLTPLHVACSRNDLPINMQVNIVRQLVECGARVDLKDVCGKHALALVNNERKERIRSILLKKKTGWFSLPRNVPCP